MSFKHRDYRLPFVSFVLYIDCTISIAINYDLMPDTKLAFRR